MGKLAQAIAHGARVISIDGNFDQALTWCASSPTGSAIELVNSVNPYRIAGQMTGAFEICDDLGEAPDVLCIPVGNAGNITAYWAGFHAYHAAGVVDRLATDDGVPGRRRGAARAGPPGRASRDGRHRDPHRQPGQRPEALAADRATPAGRSRR